jgi:Amiloride-sensitive sodium channel
MLAINTFCPKQVVYGDLRNSTNCNRCLQTLREIRIPPEEMFAECKFQDQPINCTSTFKELVIGYGLCYTFNGVEVYRTNSEVNDQEWISDVTNPWNVYPRRALGAGKQFGLSFLLKMNEHDIDYMCHGSPGFWVPYQHRNLHK